MPNTRSKRCQIKLAENLIKFNIVQYVHCKLYVPMTVHREQNMKREDQQDATIRCLLLTSVSTCFGDHYAHLQENIGPVTAFGVLFWFCWIWFVAVATHPARQRPTTASNHIQQNQNNTPNAVTGPLFS
jgi:hypothetical protein